MKIESNQIDSTYAKMPNHKTDEEKNASSTKKKENSSDVVYAGDLNLPTNTIEDKQRQAQKKALKTIMDQFKNELKSDENVSSLKDEKAKFEQDAADAASQIQSLESNKKDLKATYGVADDSAEQKDLELMEKCILRPEKITQDDVNKLKNVGSLTDYQREVLNYDKMEKTFMNRAINAGNSIQGINKSLDAIKLEKLKTHPMVDAQNDANKILQNAAEEIINALLQEGKEHVEEKMKENNEKVEKEQEKQAEKKEAEQKSQDVKNTNSSGSTTDITQVALDQPEQKQLLDSIQQVAHQQKMLDEDIKGIVVDEQV